MYYGNTALPQTKLCKIEVKGSTQQKQKITKKCNKKVAIQ